MQKTFFLKGIQGFAVRILRHMTEEVLSAPPVVSLDMGPLQEHPKRLDSGCMGLGVLLIPLLGIRVDLEATLFGDLLLTRQVDLLQAGGSLLLQGLFFTTCYRPLVFLGVDPMGAAASGLPLRTLKLAMAGVTAFVIVSSMAAVGVVLVIGLMCAPALVGLAGATSLRQAVLRASAAGMALSGGGFLLALLLNLPPDPLIGVLCVGLVVVRRRG